MKIERAAATVLFALGAAHMSAQQAPVFSSSVEVTSIDASVVDDRGKPISDLRPPDFTVHVDGSTRRVVSVQWVPLATGPSRSVAPAPAGYTSNQNATPGRLIVLAVDQPHIPFGDNAGVLGTMTGFIDRLEPSDRIAAVALGAGGLVMPFTGDRERVKQALGQINGADRDDDLPVQYDLSLAESIQIVNGNAPTIDEVVDRECVGLTGVQRGVCQNQVASDAAGNVQMARASGAQTIAGLRSLIHGLASVDAPKTVILVSERLPIVDQEELDLTELGALAGAARVSIYVVQLDPQAINAQLRRAGPVRAEDRLLSGSGLDLLAAASRGSLLRLTGDGKAQFDRIAAEMSGYYLLGLETEASDHDGRTHSVSVAVNRRGATVRSRRQLPVTTADSAKKPLAPKDAVVAALTSPFIASSLPLRVATFSVREPETSKVQVIVHADIGDAYANTEPISVGYTLVDEKTGRQVIGEEADARLSPAMRGVPSALQFVTSISTDPGDYRLTLAAADGDRVGTVEHHVHAGLVSAGNGLSLSELMVGGPASASDSRLRPTVGYSVAFGVLQAYLEAYGPTDNQPGVKYDVAATEDGPALLEAEAPPVVAGDRRTIFNQMIRVNDLPAGPYVLRASIVSGGQIVQTLTRPFEIDAPAVLMTSAAVPTAATTATDVYLPVPDEQLVRKFQRESAARGETLQDFRATVAAPARAAFDEGAKALASGDYVRAEQSFKSAIRPDSDVTAPMAYLAAVYAATGNDPQAAGAWQTTLIDGGRFPQIYEWLGDTLIRSHELAEARTVLEEAQSKWPADVRFAKPLALLYAVFGQGREAVRTLERWINAHPDDASAEALGVEWMFRLHEAGAIARTPSDDLNLAHNWADAYTKTKGPQAALVKEWMKAIENLKM